ncbi:MAG: hypothetical protein H0T15_05615 [Thermoleophilaceae bacterium]|nr:hypothetical protein [Thermoleophilaceae bacterium]
MPTTRPRYTLTDTGDLAEMLDLARKAWPEVENRKQLLLLLAEEGRAAVQRRLESDDGRARREAQLEAMRNVASRVDVDVLLSDEAWR